MKTASVAVFILQLMPELRALATALFKRHEGDVGAAREELRRIKDHGAQLIEFEEHIKSQLEQLKARAAEKAASK